MAAEAAVLDKGDGGVGEGAGAAVDVHDGVGVQEKRTQGGVVRRGEVE